MDLIITILPVVTKDLPISPRFTPYNFLSRYKFSTLTTRQPMVESSPKKNKKIIPNKSSGERLLRGYTKFDVMVDEGKGRVNPSRYRNEGKHSRRKKTCVTFLL